MDGVIKGELAALAADVESADGRCSVCGATGGKLRFCRACRFVRYYNGACQAEGWKNRGHRQACGALAADRAIAEGKGTFDLDPAAVPPLSDVLAGLSDGGHAGAYLVVVRLSLLLASAEGDNAVWEGIVAADGVPSLVASLEAGGLRACRAAWVLRACLQRNAAHRAQILADAAALPPLVRAIALPSLHADLSGFWGLRAAADAASELLGALARQPDLRPAIVEAGAIPALVSHLLLSRQARPEAWPAAALWQRGATAAGAAADALASLVLTDAAGVAAAVAAAECAEGPNQRRGARSPRQPRREGPRSRLSRRAATAAKWREPVVAGRRRPP